MLNESSTNEPEVENSGVGDIATIPIEEYNALIDFYNTFDGDSWRYNTGWLQRSGPWHGITVEAGHVTRIEFFDSGMNGTIPESIQSLTQLRFLKLRSVHLENGIPDAIGSLKSLDTLWLESCNIGGALPDTLYSLSTLKYLNLNSNDDLTSMVSPKIGLMDSLEVLMIKYNDMTGDIPEEIGLLQNLKSLGFSSRKEMGSIPATIGNLKKLEKLEVSGKTATGDIPSSLTDLTQLRWMRIVSNGFIPYDIGTLSEITYLDIRGEGLRGTIPKSIGDLRKLTSLTIERSNIIGTIPKSIGNLSELTYLNFAANNLTGLIPKELCKLKALTNLHLSRNRLRGELPRCMGDMNLEWVLMSSNAFTGTIPEGFAKNDSLMMLRLGGNYLTDTIPVDLITPHIQLSISGNYFYGTIPNTVLGSRIDESDLSRNSFCKIDQSDTIISEFSSDFFEGCNPDIDTQHTNVFYDSIYDTQSEIIDMDLRTSYEVFDGKYTLLVQHVTFAQEQTREIEDVSIYIDGGVKRTSFLLNNDLNSVFFFDSVKVEFEAGPFEINGKIRLRVTSLRRGYYNSIPYRVLESSTGELEACENSFRIIDDPESANGNFGSDSFVLNDTNKLIQLCYRQPMHTKSISLILPTYRHDSVYVGISGLLYSDTCEYEIPETREENYLVFETGAWEYPVTFLNSFRELGECPE